MTCRSSAMVRVLDFVDVVLDSKGAIAVTTRTGTTTALHGLSLPALEMTGKWKQVRVSLGNVV